MKALQSIAFSACLLWGVNGSTRVVINSPSNGSTATSPVSLNASNSGPQPNSMSVYVNDTLVLQKQAVSSLRTSLTLNPATYTIKVQARYGYRSASTAYSSVTVSSPTGTGGTPAPPT